nr:immunoglobulin light chain junction region [Macaca mulatta]
CQQYDSNPLTV